MRLFTGLLFPCIGSPPLGAGGGRLSSRTSPDTETDMNDFGRRAGGEALQFGPGGLGPVFSELGAVVAAVLLESKPPATEVEVVGEPELALEAA